MIHEYLFSTDDNRTKIEAYKPDGITVEIANIDNTPLWVVTYSLPNKNADSANKLSGVHSYIMQYVPLVLSCESSEYYNKALFPLANELERKLRKLLYLAASISNNEKAKANIKQLEEKGIGEIFDLLFIDQNFILEVKKRINAEAKSEFHGKSKYSKAEIQTYLKGLVEHTLWDAILGDKDVPTLRSEFREVQTNRNYVMHAHNIDKKRFGKAHHLFDKIIRELDDAIDNLMRKARYEPTEIKSDVNTEISSALAAMDSPSILEDRGNETASAAVLSQFSRALQYAQSLGTDTALAEALKGIQRPAMQSALAEAFKGLSPLVNNPIFTERNTILEAFKKREVLAEEIRNATPFQTNPAMESMRKQMNRISDLMKPYRQMEEMLLPYKALQNLLDWITDSFPHIAEIKSEVDEDNGSATDSGEKEEDNLNE